MSNRVTRLPWPWGLLYEAILLAALPHALLHLLGKAHLDRRYLHHLKERFGGNPDALPQQAIWFHAVSVGELHAAAPLIEDCLKASLPVLVTGQTPAVRERVASLWQARVAFSYLPYDRQPWVRRFLDTLRPRLAIFVERELWPNWFCQCAARDIPLLVINARLSHDALAHYRPIRPLVAAALRATTTIAARSKEDAHLLEQLGATSVETLGDLKQEAGAMQAHPPERGLHLAGNRPFWVAGSTHEGEEEAILEAHVTLRRACPDALLILAPRHVERIGRVRGLIRRFGLRDRCSSAWHHQEETLPIAIDVLLLDQLGILASCYAGALAGFVGGTLVPIGGHTPFEAARAACPVLMGPHRHNITEAAGRLIQHGGAWPVEATTLGPSLLQLASDRGLRATMGKTAQAVARDEAILARYRMLLASCMLQPRNGL